MILEMIEYFLTPCPRHLRKMGFLSELLGIKVRYRRCRKAWDPHLTQTMAVIREGMQQCVQRRKAVIFGSGMIYDIPLGELAGNFREVLLVDLLHPLRARNLARKFPNVRLVSEDVTGVVEEISKLTPFSKSPLPNCRSTLFLDDPEIDFVASVNLLSQLPHIPVTHLKKLGNYDVAVRDKLGAALIREHLSYLMKFPGVVTLVSDVQRLKLKDGNIVESHSAIYDVPIPWAGQRWIWHLAPRPEASRVYSFHREVLGISNIKRA